MQDRTKALLINALMMIIGFGVAAVIFALYLKR